MLATEIKLHRADAMARKQERRAAKELALANKILALPDQRFGVIVADPPLELRTLFTHDWNGPPSG